MYLYAWDLRDEGTSTVLDRLRDTGLNAVSLATAYHAGKFLRPHGPKGKVVFPEDGTVYFKPTPGRYGRLAPRAARIVEDFDALQSLADHGPDFHVTGWTVGLHNSRLGATAPDLCCQTPFGDPLINALCPSQPEVRQYLVNLCMDLAQQPRIDEIAIETPGFQTYRHGHHHEFELIQLSAAAEILLEACFCPACCQRATEAGLDAAALARQAQKDLDSFLTNGSAPELDPATHPDWQAFHACRADTVTSLVSEVRAALPAAATLAVIPTTQTPNALCWREGSDLAALAQVADRLEVPAYQSGPDAIGHDIAWVRQNAGDAANLGFIFRPSWPNASGPEDLAANVKAAASAGADRISFYNYGHIRLESLGWISRCI